MGKYFYYLHETMEPTKPSRRQLHIFFFPFFTTSREIPMMDLVKHAAAHGVKATVVTNPFSVSRLRRLTDHLNHLPIQLLAAAGLPENCDSSHLDSLLTSTDIPIRTLEILRPHAEELVRRHRPDAILSDVNLPWTAHVAKKYGIPRILFHATCCFSYCVTDGIYTHKPQEGVDSDYEYFLVPGLPDPVRITKSHFPFFGQTGTWAEDLNDKFVEAMEITYGVVLANTFYELEPNYVKHYRKVTGLKAWPVGPVFVSNEKDRDMSDGANKASVDKDRCLTWLDSKEPNSVVYVCFGTLCFFSEAQLLEIGLGLEASNCNFIWVIRDKVGDGVDSGDLEERVMGRGLIVKGWAPQVRILNHPAVGGFVTHCGWNSIVEAVVAGVPMVTWPQFADQFFNQILLLEIIKIGIGIGVDTKLSKKELAGAPVKRSRITEVVNQLMGGGETIREVRERSSRLSELARAAVRKGGSSYENLEHMIEDLLNLRAKQTEEKRESNGYIHTKNGYIHTDKCCNGIDRSK